MASERGSYQTFIRCCREPFFLDSHKQPWWHTDSYCLSFFLWAENGQRRERRSGDAFTVFLWPLPDCTYCCQAGWKGKGPTAERGCRPNQPPTQDWYWCTVIHQVYTFDKSWPLSGFKETQIRRQKMTDEEQLTLWDMIMTDGFRPPLVWILFPFNRVTGGALVSARRERHCLGMFGCFRKSDLISCSVCWHRYENTAWQVRRPHSKLLLWSCYSKALLCFKPPKRCK